jgi:N-sulfoglucosamine sulfohydrolase
MKNKIFFNTIPLKWLFLQLFSAGSTVLKNFMTQRLRIILLSFSLAQMSLIASAQTSAAHPNIVLIVSDDHGREAVGCYGNKVVQTPNIDALAKEGILFTNAFATVASCSPSRSVLLSGLYSHSNGMYGLQNREHHFSSYDTVQSLPVLRPQAPFTECTGTITCQFEYLSNSNDGIR